MTDSEFLQWIHDRMVFVHGENKNVDYLHRLRGIIAAPTDPVVEANRQLLLDRSRVGMVKYRTTLESAGLSHAELTQHALEEALDLANYLQATLRKLRGEAPAAQTEDLAGAVWDGPNTASQVDPCMGLPAKGRG